jgi:uncharacterized iron-regulated membrane protein
MKSLQSLVRSVRQFRSLHRYIGVGLAVFMLITAITGLLLGWKKNAGVLQPPTLKGVSQDIRQWKSFHQVATAAMHGMDSIGESNNAIDRMDVRLDKGIVKVLFIRGYWEVQVDGTTGKVLSLAQRHSDWIEHIHDGSIFSDLFKVIYTNMLGTGLFVLALSGLWLWYGPKVIRRSK